MTLAIRGILAWVGNTQVVIPSPIVLAVPFNDHHIGIDILELTRYLNLVQQERE